MFKITAFPMKFTWYKIKKQSEKYCSKKLVCGNPDYLCRFSIIR